MRKPIIIATAFTLALFIGVSGAWADTITYELGIGNSAISGFTGPYASVLVDLTTTTTATITYSSLTKSGNIYLLGDGGSVAVNINATEWSISGITGSNSGTGFSPGPYDWLDKKGNPITGSEDGFGTFNQQIDSFDGFSHSADMISFVITNTTVGGSWASAADVLAANADGYSVGAHIFVTSSPANASNTALATGYAVNGSVPEPSLVILLGLGFGAVSLLAYRFKA